MRPATAMRVIASPSHQSNILDSLTILGISRQDRRLACAQQTASLAPDRRRALLVAEGHRGAWRAARRVDGRIGSGPAVRARPEQSLERPPPGPDREPRKSVLRAVLLQALAGAQWRGKGKSRQLVKA